MRQTKREHRLMLRLSGPLIEQLTAEAAQENRPLADHIRNLLVERAAQNVVAAASAHAPQWDGRMSPEFFTCRGRPAQSAAGAANHGASCFAALQRRPPGMARTGCS
jgi:hypothetical protein